MASVIAEAYRNCIIRGIRVIDQVRPDELKKEVQELLVEAGRADLAGIEEGKEEVENTLPDKSIKDGEGASEVQDDK